MRQTSIHVQLNQKQNAMTVLTVFAACTDVLNRLRRADGQLRGVQRMIEAGESYLKIGQQFSAVRKALASSYLRMTKCFMEQEIDSCLKADDSQKAGVETKLDRMAQRPDFMGCASEWALNAIDKTLIRMSALTGLAISLIFGILVSTLRTLVVVPVLYYALYWRRIQARADASIFPL